MLSAIWAMLIVWQVAEHINVRKAARAALITHARDISITCGRVMRGSRFSVIPTERLESMLNPLVTNELRAVVLLNASGGVVASVGGASEIPSKEELRAGPQWEQPAVWLPNLVDLGTNMNFGYAVIPGSELWEMRTNRLMALRTNAAAAGTNGNFTTTGPRPPGIGGPPPDGPPPGRAPFGRGPPGEGFPLTRPRWMSEEDYKTVIQKAGVHSFVLNLSTQSVHDAESSDLWLRMIIGMLGTVAVVGYGLAWQSLVKTSDLQVRLVRASELNLHLKEMNLAAAGLAHETRNPLNIIRGVAQLISKQTDASQEVHAKCRDIIDETDRVTAQLNEFINYSRPREVRRAPTDLNAIVAEVARTLGHDLEEKKMALQILVEPISIEADEPLLRQALFNLVINAIQAGPANGEIRVRAARRNNEEAFIEVSDNGPGVPAAHREEVFKPYFTTHAEGTGLGLAIVQQIVKAHDWEIECLPNDPAGALFRISHVKLFGKN